MLCRVMVSDTIWTWITFLFNLPYVVFSFFLCISLLSLFYVIPLNLTSSPAQASVDFKGVFVRSDVTNNN